MEGQTLVYADIIKHKATFRNVLFSGRSCTQPYNVYRLEGEGLNKICNVESCKIFNTSINPSLLNNNVKLDYSYDMAVLYCVDTDQGSIEYHTFNENNHVSSVMLELSDIVCNQGEQNYRVEAQCGNFKWEYEIEHIYDHWVINIKLTVDVDIMIIQKSVIDIKFPYNTPEYNITQQRLNEIDRYISTISKRQQKLEEQYGSIQKNMENIQTNLSKIEQKLKRIEYYYKFADQLSKQSDDAESYFSRVVKAIKNNIYIE